MMNPLMVKIVEVTLASVAFINSIIAPIHDIVKTYSSNPSSTYEKMIDYNTPQIEDAYEIVKKENDDKEKDEGEGEDDDESKGNDEGEDNEKIDDSLYEEIGIEETMSEDSDYYNSYSM